MINPNQYIGIPWKKGGRILEEGLDCWGFFLYFYKQEFGIEIPDYYKGWLPGQTLKITREFENAVQYSGWVRITHLQGNGDAVALSKGKKIHHVGIFINGGCLHATEGAGVVWNDLKALKRNGYSRVEFYRCRQLL